jgi:predicted RNA-binding protein
LEDNEGYLSVDYSKFTAVLLQAIKEQQVLIEQQNQNNEKQQDQIEFLMEELKAIKEEIKK